MTMNRRSFTTAILWRVFLGLVLPAAVASAAVVDGNDLARNSPFLPEGYTPPQERRAAPPPPRPTPPPGPQPLDQIEFRGMTRIGGETSFSLFDPNQKRSFWIGLGQSDGGFEVVEYKQREEAVVVKHDGKSRTIPLHQSKIAALAPDAPPPPRPTETGQQRERAVQPQDPEDRMRNLAEEIRRRREIRRALVEEAEANQQQN
jgi:hypothetical protein